MATRVDPDKRSDLPGIVAVIAVTLAATVGFEWRIWSRSTGVAGPPLRAEPASAGSAVSLAEQYRRDGASPAVIDRLLDVQGDVGQPFSHAWDAVLTAAYVSAGKMTDAQRQRFARQTLTTPLTLMASTPVRAGEPLRMTASWPARGCMDGWLRYELDPAVDGRPVPDRGLVGGTESFSGGDLTADLGSSLASGGPLRVGLHHIHVTLRRQAFDWHRQPRTPTMDVSADFDLNVVSAR